MCEEEKTLAFLKKSCNTVSVRLESGCKTLPANPVRLNGLTINKKESQNADSL